MLKLKANHEEVENSFMNESIDNSSHSINVALKKPT